MAIYAGTDIETTGLVFGDHRIIEVYIGLWNDHGKLLKEYRKLINPQRSIPIESQRIHGLTLADLQDQPVFADVADGVRRMLNAATHHVAHNAAFDFPFLTWELQKAGMKLPQRTVVDTFQCAWATPDGKKPSLKEFCFACGVDYDTKKAHAASYDVAVMMQSFFRAKAWGYFDHLEEGNCEAA